MFGRLSSSQTPASETEASSGSATPPPQAASKPLAAPIAPVATEAPATTEAPVATDNSAAPDTRAQTDAVPDELVFGLTLEDLRAYIQNAGYRAEIVQEGSQEFLRSATNGLPFDIRPGNKFGPGSNRFADVAFVTLFAVRGTLPMELMNSWNRGRRFGRLFVDEPAQTFLVFCMDVAVAGGVTRDQLRAQIEIWDGLVQQLVPWLREEIAKLTPSLDPSGSTDGSETDEAPALPGT